MDLNGNGDVSTKSTVGTMSLFELLNNMEFSSSLLSFIKPSIESCIVDIIDSSIK
jgi:hypothetical protein